MAKSSEMAWLDAIEAEQSGDRAAALDAAKKTVSIDPAHADGWMGVARWSLPAETRGKQEMPDLKQSAMAMAARPSCSARSTYSSGWEAPVRKVKFEVAEISVNMGSDALERLAVYSRFVLF